VSRLTVLGVEVDASQPLGAGSTCDAPSVLTKIRNYSACEGQETTALTGKGSAALGRIKQLGRLRGQETKSIKRIKRVRRLLEERRTWAYKQALGLPQGAQVGKSGDRATAVGRGSAWGPSRN